MTLHRRLEGGAYRNGLNWSYVRHASHWWFAAVICVGRIRLGFRYRSVLTPHFINYSAVIS